MVEVEVRTLVDNKKRLIEKAKEFGFIEVKTMTQHDIIFDKPDASLFKSGKKIRIRIEGQDATLTYKGDLTGDKNISKRQELNISIFFNDIDYYKEFLSAIGYPICFQLRKERTILKKEDVLLSFDEWPILGCMLEIEGPEEKIKEWAKCLAPELVFSNYRLKELFESKMKETGKSLQMLKEEYFKETQFDLGNIELILD